MFDTIGKKISDQAKLYTPFTVKCGVILRFIFIGSFVIIVVRPDLPIIGTNYFIIANMALFSLLNGLLTGALFIIVSESA